MNNKAKRMQYASVCCVLIFLLLYRIIARVISVITALAHRMFFFDANTPFLLRCAPQSECQHPLASLVTFWFFFFSFCVLKKKRKRTAIGSDIIMRLASWPPTAWEQKLSNLCAAPKADKRSALCAAPKADKRSDPCAAPTADKRSALCAAQTHALCQENHENKQYEVRYE